MSIKVEISEEQIKKLSEGLIPGPEMKAALEKLHAEIKKACTLSQEEIDALNDQPYVPSSLRRAFPAWCRFQQWRNGRLKELRHNRDQQEEERRPPG